MSMRPRVRLIVADPVKVNWQRAGIWDRISGFVLIDLRGLVHHKEVRAAGTPSCYPSLSLSNAVGAPVRPAKG